MPANPDTLRSLQNIFEPDERSQGTLSDHTARIEAILLHKEVPNEIQVMFDTARNLALYAWCAYRFIPVAERHAYSTIEYALKKRMSAEGVQLGRHEVGLRGYLDYAIRAAWVTPEDLEMAMHRRKMCIRQNEDRISAGLPPIYSAEQIQAAAEDYLRALPETLSKIRNDYSHGSWTIHGHSVALAALSRCRDLVNALYRETAPEGGLL